MTLSPVPVETFGGLNLVDDPGQIGWGQAIDALNVDLSTPGVLKSRPGYVTYNDGTPATDRYVAIQNGRNGRHLAYRKDGGSTTLVITTDSFSGLSEAATTSIASVAFGTGPLISTVYGTDGANNEWAYVLDPTLTGAPYRVRLTGVIAWDHPAFTGAEAPDAGARALAVTPWDNRLVVGGATSDPARLKFSDAGSPLNFPTNNYIQLAPNRESITTMAVWQNLLFVFTTKAIYVFYGTSTDSSGNPIFNYRRVETGSGSALPDCACPGPDGLYYATLRGLYKTTGGDPVKVSGNASQLVGTAGNGPFPPTYTGYALLGTPAGLRYVNGHIIVSGQAYDTTPAAATGAFWVLLNPETGSVTGWNLTHGGSTFAVDVDNAQSSGTDLIYFPNLTGDKGFARMIWRGFTAPLTTDNGTAITSRYRSGFSDLNTPDMKRIHSFRLQGSGSPTLKLSTDFGALETGAAVTLGTAPAIAEGVRRYAPRGRQFSWQVGGTTAWSLNNFIANVAGTRKAGEHGP